MIDSIKVLESVVLRQAIDIQELLNENTQLETERDEARREFLREFWAKDDTDDERLAKEDALNRGWDCFKENTDGR